MEEERKAFTFFRSYYDAAKALPDPKDIADFYVSVAAYAFDDIEPENITPIAQAMFALAKPTLDASKKKSVAGSNGGSKTQAKRKQTSSTSQAEVKQTSSKPQAEVKQEPSTSQAEVKQTSSDIGYRIKDEGDRIKDTKKELPSDEGSKKKPQQEKFAEFVSMTAQEHESLVQQFGEVDTLRLIDILNNYKGSTGKRYKSDYRAILSWCVQRLDEEKRKAGNSKQTHTQVQPHGADPARVKANVSWMRELLADDEE